MCEEGATDSPFAQDLFSPNHESEFLNSTVCREEFSAFNLFSTEMVSSLVHEMSFLYAQELVDQVFSIFARAS